MSSKKIVVTIVLLGIIFALLGVLLAMNSTGVFDLKAALANLPIIGEKFKVEDQIMIIKPLEDENYQLRQEIQEARKSLEEKEKEKEELIEEIDAYKQEVVLLKEQIAQSEKLEYQNSQIALYYSKMEDRQATKIFDNLDDDKVLGILTELPPEKAGSILAAMDPVRAAKLTAVLTDKINSSTN